MGFPRLLFAIHIQDSGAGTFRSRLARWHLKLNTFPKTPEELLCKTSRQPTSHSSGRRVVESSQHYLPLHSLLAAACTRVPHFLCSSGSMQEGPSTPQNHCPVSGPAWGHKKLQFLLGWIQGCLGYRADFR